MPVPDLAHLVTTSSKKSFKAAIPKVLEYLSERAAAGQDLQLSQLVNTVQAGIGHFKTPNRHVVVVDGLDSIFSQRDLQFQSLAALISEAARLNGHFSRQGANFKFVVLCRTDIFDRLPGANINKFRQDRAETLNWYDAPREPDRTRLIRLVNLRAGLSLNRSVNVFSEFFPRRIGDRAVRTVILDQTRHTPRDLVQLLRYTQRFADGAGKLTPRQVKSGLRAYSIEYFLPELRNELSGYLEQGQIENAIVLLTTLQSQRLAMQDLQRQADHLGYDALDLRVLTGALFDASCIGTIEEKPGHRPLFTFKYRNPNATLMPDQVMWIHPGALTGLNIVAPQPRSRGRGTPPPSRRKNGARAGRPPRR